LEKTKGLEEQLVEIIKLLYSETARKKDIEYIATLLWDIKKSMESKADKKDLEEVKEELKNKADKKDLIRLEEELRIVKEELKKKADKEDLVRIEKRVDDMYKVMNRLFYLVIAVALTSITTLVGLVIRFVKNCISL
jgi:rRNA maturation endonuclease Nob1